MNINLAEKLNTTLEAKFTEAIKQISTYANKYSYKAYIIGGVVRDLILDRPIYDIDIVIEGNAINFCNLVENEKIWAISRISKEFGTAKVTIQNKLEVDFASTRIETYPNPGKLPVVTKIGCSLKDDILRRDFTVNALAISLNKNNFGKVIDFTTGLEDIQKRELKILHNKSFIDDPTRIIRAIRFKHKLNFNIERQTKILQNEYLKHFNNEDICYERIKQVTKLAFNTNSAQLFDEFVSQNIFKLLSTNIRKCSGNAIFTAISKYKTQFNNSNIWLIYLACLMTPEQAEKLNLNAKETEIINNVETLLQTSTNFKTNYEIYNFFKNKSIESIISYIALTNLQHAHTYLNNLKNIKLHITGKNLIELGYQENKMLGTTIEKILEEKINGNILTKEDEINLAKKLLSQEK